MADRSDFSKIRSNFTYPASACNSNLFNLERQPQIHLGKHHSYRCLPADSFKHNPQKRKRRLQIYVGYFYFGISCFRRTFLSVFPY